MVLPQALTYDNLDVTNASNPSALGHHHGPIPNQNPGWVPPRQQASHDAGTRAPQVTTADNDNPPNPPAALANLNTGVCDIVVGDGLLCGIVFSGRQTQPTLRRHARNTHPGALVNPGRGNISQRQQIAGQNAIKLWVRSGGWRDARYLNEPGRGPLGSYLDLYASEMETIARNDAAFAARFGTRFHRPRRVLPTPELRSKRRRGPEPPFRDESPSVKNEEA